MKTKGMVKGTFFSKAVPRLAREGHQLFQLVFPASKTGLNLSRGRSIQMIWLVFAGYIALQCCLLSLLLHYFEPGFI